MTTFRTFKPKIWQPMRRRQQSKSIVIAKWRKRNWSQRTIQARSTKLWRIFRPSKLLSMLKTSLIASMKSTVMKGNRNSWGKSQIPIPVLRGGGQKMEIVSLNQFSQQKSMNSFLKEPINILKANWSKKDQIMIRLKIGCINLHSNLNVLEAQGW